MRLVVNRVGWWGNVSGHFFCHMQYYYGISNGLQLMADYARSTQQFEVSKRYARRPLFCTGDLKLIMLLIYDCTQLAIPTGGGQHDVRRLAQVVELYT